MGYKTIVIHALLQVICLAVFSITAAAQVCKLGAKHPDGGFVFSADQSGESGFIVAEASKEGLYVKYQEADREPSLGRTDVLQDPVVSGQGGARSARQATPPPAATATPRSVTTAKSPPATAAKQNEGGFLYNAYAVKSAADVCPAGWRVPTQADFQALIDLLKPDAHRKLSDPKFWGSGSKMTNASGFGARARGGFAGDAPDGGYDFGKTAYFWSATTSSEGQSHLLMIDSGSANPAAVAGDRYGFCVRCLSEQPGDGTATPSIMDADGNSYKTVRVGQQLWMAEDLRTTKFSDGTPIPFVSDKSQWVKLNAAAYTSVSQLPPVSTPAAGDPFKMPLPPGTTLRRGKRYVSSDGKHYLIFQDDNNLVIYRVDNDGFVWGLNEQPNVDYKKANAARVTDQRRFTVVDSANREIWGLDMNDASGLIGTHLDITSDGHLTARDP